MEFGTLLAPKTCSSNLLLAYQAQQQVLDPLDKDWSNPAVDWARAGPCEGREWCLPSHFQMAAILGKNIDLMGYFWKEVDNNV